MRCLERNKRPLWYALRVGEEETVDGFGHPTGEVKPVYGEPRELRIFQQDGAGAYGINAYGTASVCDKILVTSDMELPIDEETVFWIDAVPADNGTVPHDYVMAAPPIQGLNQVVYKLRRVGVSYA